MFSFFDEKNNLLGLFVGIRVESHFPLVCPSIYLLKSLFKLVPDKFILSIKEKKENVVCKELGICSEAF